MPDSARAPSDELAAQVSDTEDSALKICIVTPAPPHSRSGNRVTATRWRRILEALGHRVTIENRYNGGRCNLLIALHARKSAESADAYRQTNPAEPLVVALTGTDVYHEDGMDSVSTQCLTIADRIVALQPLAANELPDALRAKTVTIYQSSRSLAGKQLRMRSFDVCVVGHLREVKDPFRAGKASRLLRPSSKVRVILAGAALEREFEKQAGAESARNPRFRWLGEVPRWKARLLVSRSHILVISSLAEGGANVISEALAASTPILASRIPGNVGLLGADYIGYFTPGSTEELADLINRAETDSVFYSHLSEQCAARKWIADPALEWHSWRKLIEEITN